MFIKRMNRNKNILKTFGILLLTFVGLLGIAYVMLMSINSVENTYLEKRNAIITEKINSGMDIKQAMDETILEEDPVNRYNIREETKNKAKIGYILGLAAAIILLYISSIAITYVTRKRT